MTKVTLDPVAARTKETRRDWAIRRSTALQKRRIDLDGGAPRATGMLLADAVAKYFEDHPQLRDETKALYRSAADKFLAWSKRTGLKKADDVTGARLVAFRATLVKEPKRVRAAGGKRGAMKDSGKPRSPYTVNRELRSIGTVLNYVRRLGLLPKLSTDDLRDGLKKLKTGGDPPEHRKPKELQRLLEAALRHDAAVFDATRDEHAGTRQKGTTARYEPIAPLVAFVLLTGMRFNEALGLEWSQVDLEALGEDGKPIGEIRLRGAEVKTGIGRSVWLDVSPALRKLLAAMKLKSGGKGRVFPMTEGTAVAAARRLVTEFGAPAACNWQVLRSTCETYLVNAGGIYGASSAYLAAKQLGHSVQVAERHYLGVVRGIPKDARDLETAMQVKEQLDAIIAATGTRPAKVRKIG